MSDHEKNPNPPETKAPPMRVYEAGEGVNGMTPRLQYTEHKKMTPQEFGCCVKQSMEKEALGHLAAPLILGGATLASAIPGLYWMAGGQGGTGKPPANYGNSATMGGLAGGALGALHGAISPGEETEYDAEGNVIGKKRRGMLGGMLRGGLAGAGMGAAGGLAAEHLAPGTANQLQSGAAQFGKKMQTQMGLRKPEYNRGWVGWGMENALAYNPVTAIPYWTGMGKGLYQNSYTGSYE